MKFILPFLLLLSACGIDDTRKTGMHKNSQSIEESKANGVFKQSLMVDKPIIRIGFNRTDSLKQIWAESAWTYENKNGHNIVQKDTSFVQLLILLSNLSTKYNDSVWLMQKKAALGWNGVYFGKYTGKDTIIVFRKLKDYDIPVDTLIVTK